MIAAFPPVVESKLSDIAEEGRPPVIRFKEDDIRDAFNERFPLLKRLPINLLANTNESVGESESKIETGREKYKKDSLGMPSLDTLIAKYKEYVKTGIDSDTAISKTVEWVLLELQDAKLKSTWAKQVQQLKKQDKDLTENYEEEEDVSDVVDIADLFKLSKFDSKAK